MNGSEREGLYSLRPQTAALLMTQRRAMQRPRARSASAVKAGPAQQTKYAHQAPVRVKIPKLTTALVPASIHP